MSKIFILAVIVLLIGFGCSKEPPVPFAPESGAQYKNTTESTAKSGKPSVVTPTMGTVILELASDVVRGKKVAMIIASTDFRDEEYQIPRQILEKEGVQITVFSSSTAEAKGMLGKVLVTPDKTIDQLKAKEFDAVVFIGGTGAKEYFDNTTALMIARDTVAGNKILGAICLAPRILANSGVLTGKTATIVPSEGAYLKTKMVRYEDKKNVCVDGKIITANGPEAAGEFGQAILNALRGK